MWRGAKTEEGLPALLVIGEQGTWISLLSLEELQLSGILTTVASSGYNPQVAPQHFIAPNTTQYLTIRKQKAMVKPRFTVCLVAMMLLATIISIPQSVTRAQAYNQPYHITGYLKVDGAKASRASIKFTPGTTTAPMRIRTSALQICRRNASTGFCDTGYWVTSALEAGQELPPYDAIRHTFKGILDQNGQLTLVVRQGSYVGANQWQDMRVMYSNSAARWESWLGDQGAEIIGMNLGWVSGSIVTCGAHNRITGVTTQVECLGPQYKTLANPTVWVNWSLGIPLSNYVYITPATPPTCIGLYSSSWWVARGASC